MSRKFSAKISVDDAKDTKTWLSYSDIEIIAEKILRFSSRSGLPLRNIKRLQWIFCPLHILLLSSFTDKIFTDLTMSNTTVVLQETGTAKSSRAHGLNSGFMVGLQLLIILVLHCFIFISPLFYSKIILFFYHICFTRQTSA